MYHRLILQTPDGKTFIRYLRKNVRIFAEVLQADSKNELYDSIMHLADQMPDMPVLFYAVTDFSGSFYACVVIEADNMNNTPVDSFEKKMQTTVNRLINWYKYTYLIPVSKGNLPITNTEYDDED